MRVAQRHDAHQWHDRADSVREREHALAFFRAGSRRISALAWKHRIDHSDGNEHEDRYDDDAQANVGELGIEKHRADVERPLQRERASRIRALQPREIARVRTRVDETLREPRGEDRCGHDGRGKPRGRAPPSVATPGDGRHGAMRADDRDEDRRREETDDDAGRVGDPAHDRGTFERA